MSVRACGRVTGGVRGVSGGPDEYDSNSLLSLAKPRANGGFERVYLQVFSSAIAFTCDGLNQIQIIIGSKHTKIMQILANLRALRSCGSQPACSA